MFFVIALLVARLIGAALGDVMQATQACHFWAVGMVCAAFFAGHSSSIGMLDAWLQGRLALPPRAALPPPASSARNPWGVAVQCACLWGGPAAAISCWLVLRESPNGVPVIGFSYQFATASALLSAAVVLVRSGTPFLQQAQPEPAQRRFAGTQRAYLWQRQILPQAIVNGSINVWVGAAIVPAPLSDASATVPAVFVQQDAVATAFGLALAVVGGAYGHARFDRRWGVVGERPTSLSAGARAGVLIGVIVLAGGLGSIPRVLGYDAVNAQTLVVVRSLACTIYSAVLAYWMADWALLTKDEAA